MVGARIPWRRKSQELPPLAERSAQTAGGIVNLAVTMMVMMIWMIVLMLIMMMIKRWEQGYHGEEKSPAGEVLCLSW